jgi:hypothetical protein
MQITISFRPGFDVEGVVLSAAGARLRVAMRDWDDAAEFQCHGGQWFSENGDPVQIAWPESFCLATTEGLPTERLCGRASLPSTASNWVN